MEYNPRFVIYSQSHGLTPEQMVESDKVKWPGVAYTGFLLWISKGLQEFKARSPQAFLGDTLVDQDGFTAFLWSTELVGYHWRRAAHYLRVWRFHAYCKGYGDDHARCMAVDYLYHVNAALEELPPL